MSNANTPEYPVIIQQPGTYEAFQYTGLTKREIFTIAALQGMAMRATSLPDYEVAYAAVSLADATIAELGRAK